MIIIKVKAFMDALMHEGFSEVLQDEVLQALEPYNQDDTIEFEMVIKNVKKVPYDENFSSVEIKND